MSEYEKLKKLIQELRHPETGCPWDLEQTGQSLLPYLLEETFEAYEAIQANDPKGTQEELGDILLQIALHSQLANEQEQFSLDDVVKGLNEKLITRHPHVFDQHGAQYQTLTSAQDVAKKWQERKAAGEKRPPTFLKDKLLYNTALGTAQKIGEKTAEVHFDWQDANQVQYKVEEEWQELKEEITSLTNNKLPDKTEAIKERMAEEMGDFLFSIVQLARHLDLNAEDCLRQANRKFIKRFRTMEKHASIPLENLSELGPEQWENLWNLAKKGQ